MGYLSTDKIKVFPSTRRGREQVDARLMTEAAMVGIINQLVNKKGFIITQDDEYNLSNKFKFNIAGYYFEVDTAQDIFDAAGAASSNTKLYAKITIDESNDYYELAGTDSNSQYQGISFEYRSDTPSDSSSVSLVNKYFLLFEKISGVWIVANSSKLKFSDSDLDIDIDGGWILKN